MDDDDDWDEDPLADAIKACELKSSTAEDTGLYPFRLFTGTWNVNAKKPREDLKSWLFGHGKAGPTADIYVVGFQEIVDLSTKVCCKDEAQGKCGERASQSNRAHANANMDGGGTGGRWVLLRGWPSVCGTVYWGLHVLRRRYIASQMIHTTRPTTRLTHIHISVSSHAPAPLQERGGDEERERGPDEDMDGHHRADA